MCSIFKSNRRTLLLSMLNKDGQENLVQLLIIVHVRLIHCVWEFLLWIDLYVFVHLIVRVLDVLFRILAVEWMEQIHMEMEVNVYLIANFSMKTIDDSLFVFVGKVLAEVFVRKTGQMTLSFGKDVTFSPMIHIYFLDTSLYSVSDRIKVFSLIISILLICRSASNNPKILGRW